MAFSAAPEDLRLPSKGAWAQGPAARRHGPQGGQSGPAPPRTWQLVWCTEHCNKDVNRPLRDGLRQAGRQAGAAVFSLKKVAKLLDWLGDRFNAKIGPYILVTDWREAKPCHDAFVADPTLPRPLVHIVQTDARKTWFRAKEWAHEHSSESLELFALEPGASAEPRGIVEAALAKLTQRVRREATAHAGVLTVPAAQRSPPKLSPGAVVSKFTTWTSEPKVELPLQPPPLPVAQQPVQWCWMAVPVAAMGMTSMSAAVPDIGMTWSSNGTGDEPCGERNCGDAGCFETGFSGVTTEDGSSGIQTPLQTPRWEDMYED